MSNWISSLHCPYTGSPFEAKAIDSEHGPAIDFGVVSSEAGQFPVISGILRLISDELQEPLVDLLKQGQKEAALLMALEVPFNTRRARVVNRLWRVAHGRKSRVAVRLVGQGKRHLYRLVTETDITFAELAARTGVEAWANWQTYRFSMPTFLAVHALSHLAKGSKTVLDFGCGLGQSAFLMKRLASEARVVCADYSFTALYLAKRFLVPDAPCICLDGDYPLPFGERYFDCVFSTDAMQYIESKLCLAQEFQRVLSDDGMIVLSHLHNRFSPIKTGKALTPGGYDGLFEGMARHMYPEDSIVADYVANGSLDLERRWAVDDLCHSLSGLSLVATNRKSVFGTYTELWDANIDAMRYPKLNPLYRARRSGGTWALERGIGAPYAIERTIQDCVVLPRTWQADIESCDSAGILTLRDADRAQLRELVRRFLILDMPESYT